MTPGSKAEKQGILVGDFLVSINNQPCEGMNHSNALNCVKKSGKDLTLTLERYGVISFLFFMTYSEGSAKLVGFSDMIYLMGRLSNFWELERLNRR